MARELAYEDEHGIALDAFMHCQVSWHDACTGNADWDKRRCPRCGRDEFGRVWLYVDDTEHPTRLNEQYDCRACGYEATEGFDCIPLLTMPRLEEAYSRGVLRIIQCPHDESEVVCQVGDTWFYAFGSPDDYNPSGAPMTGERYVRAVGLSNALRILSNSLHGRGGFSECFPEEYAYICYFVDESLGQAA